MPLGRDLQCQECGDRVDDDELVSASECRRLMEGILGLPNSMYHVTKVGSAGWTWTCGPVAECGIQEQFIQWCYPEQSCARPRIR